MQPPRGDASQLLRKQWQNSEAGGWEPCVASKDSQILNYGGKTELLSGKLNGLVVVMFSVIIPCFFRSQHLLFENADLSQLL